MFSKISCIVLAAAVAVHALPAPLPLPEPLPATNNTRNYTIGNTTFFNQTNGAQAACARGIRQWCTTKRNFEPVGLDVGVLNGDSGSGHIASVQSGHGESGVHVGAVDDGVDIGLGNKQRRSLSVGALNDVDSDVAGRIASAEAEHDGLSAIDISALDDGVDVDLGDDSDVDGLFHPYGFDD